MLIPRNLLPVSAACDTENNSRYDLAAVQLEREPSGPVAVAMDGRVMLIARWTEDAAETWPAAAGDASPKDGFTALVPRKDWDGLGKLPPKRCPKATLLNAAILEHESNGRIPAVGTDLDTTRRVDILPLEGRFPRWRDIESQYSERQPEAVTIAVDARLLAKAATALAKMIPSQGHSRVTMSVPVDGESAIVLRAESETDHDVKVVAVVMPLAKN